MSGFILLHRDLIGNPQFRGKDDEYAAIWLITNVAWEPTTVRVSGKLISLDRGQCCFATSFLGQAWECSKATAHARLRHFEKNGFIRTEVRTGITVITVCKYADYQPSPNAPRTHVQTSPERSPNDVRTKKNEGNEVKKDSAAADARAGDAASPLTDPATVNAIGRRVLDLMGVSDDPRWIGSASRVDGWLASGADPEADIFPTVIRLMTARNGEPPRSLKYFDAAIAEAVRDRTFTLTTATGGPSHGNHRHRHRHSDRIDTHDRRRAIAEVCVGGVDPG